MSLRSGTESIERSSAAASDDAAAVVSRLKVNWEKAAQALEPDLAGYLKLLAASGAGDCAGVARVQLALAQAITKLERDGAKRMPRNMALGVAQVLSVVEESLDAAVSLEALEPKFAWALERLDAALRLDTQAKPETLTRPPLDRGVLASLRREVLVALQSARTSLQAFGGPNSRKSDGDHALDCLRQASAALRVGQIEQAAGLAQLCAQKLEALLNGGAAVVSQDLLLIVNTLDVLGRFLRSQAEHTPDGLVSLDGAAQRLAGGPPPSKPEEGPVAVADGQHEVADDPEILEVFSEELSEWLAMSAAQIAALKATPEDPEVLACTRRAFHTLKGSSRVAGFTRIGDFAFKFEELLNAWIAAEKPAEPGLVELLEEATQRLSGWLATLNATQTVSVDAPELLEAVERLRLSGTAAGGPGDRRPGAAVDAVPAREVVTLGDSLTVSKTLFEIFTQEAAKHLATLRQELAGTSSGKPVKPDFVRAAHTLAGISRTVGFPSLAELAHALEKLLQNRQEAFAALDDREGAQAKLAVANLNDALVNVRQFQMPVVDADLTARLRDMAAAATRPGPAVMPAAVPHRHLSQSEIEAAFGAVFFSDAVIEHGPQPELRDTFMDEAVDLVGQLAAEAQRWCGAPDDERHPNEVFRLLHTLKGCARSAGAMALGEIVHRMESSLQETLRDGPLTDALLYCLQTVFDQWCESFERAAPGLVTALSGVSAHSGQAGSGGQLRVPVEALERLFDTSAEILLTRLRIAAEVETAKRAVADMHERVQHMREHLREIEIHAESQMRARFEDIAHSDAEFDPLEFDRYTRLQELTRIMAESLYDLTTVQFGVDRSFSEAEAIIDQQSRLQRNLHSDLMHIRTVPFVSANNRLQRIVRQTAAELGRAVRLTLSGAHLEIDRAILERLMPLLEHMIRNGIAHGIESAEQRRAAGKPEAGLLHIALSQEVNTIKLVFSDDGRGIDTARVRAKAEELGLVQPGDYVDDERLQAFIFQPGFSTAEELTEIAGRGVGMDIVQDTIQRLGGEIAVNSEPGHGTRFSLAIPLTLVVAQALVVRCADRNYGIPTNLIAHIQRCDANALMNMLVGGATDWDGESYAVRYVGDLLGLDTVSPMSKRNNIVLFLRGGRDRLALHVDAIVANQEFALRELGPQLADATGLVGATIGEDGNPMLLINPLRFAGRAVVQDVSLLDSTPPLVLIVDDSVTVRKVTGRLIERAGYRVATAKDGFEAIERIREEIPAIVLMDIEMPRMDGFELTKHIRDDPRTEHTPIIVISSRTADKHRQHAYDLGVTLFLGKPFQDLELLTEIERVRKSSQPRNVLKLDERRKHPRIRLKHTLAVADAVTQKSLGTVANISISGFMLQTRERLKTNRVHHLELLFPDEVNEGRPLRFVAESKWLESSFENGQFWVGMKFLDLTDEENQIIESAISICGI